MYIELHINQSVKLKAQEHWLTGVKHNQKYTLCKMY